MKTLLHIALIAFLLCGLSACGNKGSLKSPTETAKEEQKAARKKAQQAEKQSTETPAEPAPAQEPQ